MDNQVNTKENNISIPPAPMKDYPQIFVDNKWKIKTPNVCEIPIPPAPKRGYRETLVDNNWVFIKRIE